MLAPPDRTSGTGTGGQEPGWARRSVAECLTERGLNVDVPEQEEGGFLTITTAGDAHCQVDVEDDQNLLCAYFSPGSMDARPADIAGMVLGLLGVRDDVPAGSYARLYRGATLKGAVGREMIARGLNVRMDVIENHEFYSVTADIVVDDPARPERGTIRLADDPWLQWEFYFDDLPGGPAEIADTITRALTPRASQLRDEQTKVAE
jgi:hypothetical protein